MYHYLMSLILFDDGVMTGYESLVIERLAPISTAIDLMDEMEFVNLDMEGEAGLVNWHGLPDVQGMGDAPYFYALTYRGVADEDSIGYGMRILELAEPIAATSHLRIIEERLAENVGAHYCTILSSVYMPGGRGSQS